MNITKQIHAFADRYHIRDGKVNIDRLQRAYPGINISEMVKFLRAYPRFAPKFMGRFSLHIRLLADYYYLLLV